MTLYRNMTTLDLVRHGSGQAPHPAYRRALIKALAERLEQEYERANRHLEKSIEAARWRVKLEPAVGYIKVAKPHIQQVFTVPGNKGMWRCTGSFGTVQYGSTPSEAYTAWRKVMEQGHGVPRQPPARFRMNYMRRE